MFPFIVIEVMRCYCYTFQHPAHSKHHKEVFSSCYHFANVQSRGVRLPADGPQEAVHFLNGSDLLLVVLLLRVSGDDRHLQSFVCFTHRLHLRILPKIYARVLQLFGAVCAYEAVKAPQDLHIEYESARGSIHLR